MATDSSLRSTYVFIVISLGEASVFECIAIHMVHPQLYVCN